ncbi:hypothetical protein Tco_0819472 [Tanacetum coccineum]|uniref:Uncharacterized protein n=1 Tax=Tanacetum coccineum TaxID=301880 RepID=A0ABQ5AAM8_9ASTR
MMRKIRTHKVPPQVLPSFEEYTPLVTYPNEVEETIGLLIEVEPLDKTPLEDLGLNTYNHDTPLSSRKVPSLDEPNPQPQPLPSYPSLDASLGDQRDHEPPIKPHSPDSFRMKEVDSLTINTPPLPHVASFHPKDTHFYYHPCIDNPKKHYGFKLVLSSDLTNKITCRKFLIKNGEEIFTDAEDGVIFDEKKLGNS